MQNIPNVMNIFRTTVNSVLADKEPWQIVSLTTCTVLFYVWTWEFMNQDEGLVERTKRFVFRMARRIPSVRQHLDKKLAGVAADFQKDVEERTRDMAYTIEVPEEGTKVEDILEALRRNLDLGNFKWRDGRVSGAVYHYDERLCQLLASVFEASSYTNPLHPDVFPGVCKMEAEVIRMSSNLFHGDDDVCGTVTTGGTESILLACKAYRELARETRGIRCAEIVMPVTAHCAFNKAAHFLGMRIRCIPVDPETRRVDLRAMKRNISRNTAMLVASAPNFPYGTMDDVEAVAALGKRYNIPVHVDSCLGGFLLAFMDNPPPFDFKVEGVTSISADTHKYAYAPKGSSVLLYRSNKYLHHQYTVTTDWPGGIYGSPTVAGSRAGALIAACWATMLYIGRSRYVETAREIIKTARYIEEQLRTMDGIYIFGKPATSVIAIGSNVFDIFRLSDALAKNGWNLNVLQFPSGIHLCVTNMHTQSGVADRFLDDVRREVAEIMKQPEKPVEGKMAIYGVAQSLPDRSIVGDFTRLFLDSMYFTPNSKNSPKQ